MGIFDYRITSRSVKEKITGLKSHGVALFSSAKNIVSEAAKGRPQEDNRTLVIQSRGVPHPHDMRQMNDLYIKIPIVHGAINKIVDFTIGNGFRLECKVPRVIELAQSFMKSLDFDNLLRRVGKDMNVYGNAYLEIVKSGNTIIELIPRSPETMYVKRDEKGNVIGYVQIVSALQKPIEFTPDEIAHFRLGQNGDSPYGLSVLFPLVQVLQRKLTLEQAITTITNRKANAPYDITVGDENNFPSTDDLNEIKADLESLQNDNEWVHGPMVKIDAIGFKDKVMDVQPYLAHFEDQIVFGLEVPMVLLGKGNIPEGLASVQMEAFERKIVSIQLAMEKVLETQIFPMFLESQGFTGVEIEFEWKEPDDAERQAEVTTLLSAVNTGKMGTFSMEFITQCEQRIADLLGFEDFEAPERPELDLAPPMPGQNKGNAQLAVKQYSVTEHFDKQLYEAPLKEFVGFNYSQYLKQIHEFIDSKNFVKRKYVGPTTTSTSEWEEKVIKYKLTDNLSKAQVQKLRTVLHSSFDDGASIRTIKERILEQVKPKDLSVKVPARYEDGELVRKAYRVHINKDQRAWALARTETIRASNQGALGHFDQLKVPRVEWLATNDDRTCAYCSDRDGESFDLEEADEMIPGHDLCRCTWKAVTE